jgi:small subunit ribosomal protein S9
MNRWFSSCRILLNNRISLYNINNNAIMKSFSSTSMNNLDPLAYLTDINNNDTNNNDNDKIKNNNNDNNTKLRVPIIDELGRSYGTGRRKTSVARVWIKDGSGQFIVNDKQFIDVFQPVQREHILEAFLASNTAGFYDVWCTVKGGGINGQAGAVRLGISRALQNYDPALRPPLKAAGLLTRDSRRVERKKPGQKKARKKFQWVKR